MSMLYDVNSMNFKEAVIIEKLTNIYCGILQIYAHKVTEKEIKDIREADKDLKYYEEEIRNSLARSGKIIKFSNFLLIGFGLALVFSLFYSYVLSFYLCLLGLIVTASIKVVFHHCNLDYQTVANYKYFYERKMNILSKIAERVQNDK